METLQAGIKDIGCRNLVSWTNDSANGDTELLRRFEPSKILGGYLTGLNRVVRVRRLVAAMAARLSPKSETNTVASRGHLGSLGDQ